MLRFVFDKLVFLFLLNALFVLGVFAQSYTNPVIAGDFPDPSVIRVGEDFYAQLFD